MFPAFFMECLTLEGGTYMLSPNVGSQLPTYASQHLEKKGFNSIPVESVTGRLYPRRNPWYSFSEAESTSGQVVLSEGNTEKNSQ
jgi:hypothetical protein